MARLLFYKEFAVEVTLVPGAETGACSWFVVSVEVESLRAVTRHGLSGIFQARHNNRVPCDTHFLSRIAEDCRRYVDLFYYEMLQSQFSLLASTLGREVCSLQRSSGTVPSFSVSFWFRREPVTVALDGMRDVLFLTPAVSFDDGECRRIVAWLFAESFETEVGGLLDDLRRSGTIVSFEQRSGAGCRIRVFDCACVVLALNAFSTKIEVGFSGVASSLLDEMDGLAAQFAGAVAALDREQLVMAIEQLKTRLFVQCLSHGDAQSGQRGRLSFAVVTHPAVSNGHSAMIVPSATDTCISLRPMSGGEVQATLWRVTSRRMEVELVPMDIVQVSEERVMDRAGLFAFVDAVLTRTRPQTLKNSLLARLAELSVDAVAVSPDRVRIMTLGLPSWVTSASLHLDEEERRVFGSLQFGGAIPRLRGAELVAPRVPDALSALRWLQSGVRAIMLAEFWSLEDASVRETLMLDPLRLVAAVGGCTVEVSLDGAGMLRLVSSRECDLLALNVQLNADDFNVYAFHDELMSVVQRQSRDREQVESSPDLAWLSDSFM